MANVFLAPSDMAVLMRGNRTADAEAQEITRDVARERVWAALPEHGSTGVAEIMRLTGLAFGTVAIALGDLRTTNRLRDCSALMYGRKG